MKLSSKIILLAALLCVLLVPASAFASQYTVYAGELPPFNYKAESGHAEGIAIDLLVEIMKDVGSPIVAEDIRCIDWPKALKDVEMTPNTILVSAALTPERDFKFKWVGPIYALNIGLVAHKKSEIRIRTKHDVNNYRIGVIRNSAPVSMLGAGYGLLEENLILVDSSEELFLLLKEGKVDLISHSDMSTPLLMKQFGMAPDEYEMVHVMTKMNLYYLLNKDTKRGFLNTMQEVLEAMKRSRFDVIVNNYLGESGPIKIVSP